VTKHYEQASTTKPVKENVVDGVLQNYLDQLLVTATQPQRVEKVIHIPDAEPLIETPPAVEASVQVEADVVRQVETVEIDVVPEINVEAAMVAEPVMEQAQAVSETPQPLIDQESWSSQGVECLVFSLCGLKLAVPLLYLGGVHEISPEDVKPLMGQPEWYLGMVHTGEQNLQVIDTANFIMPERGQNLAGKGYKYLIQLEKTPWVIACQSIDDTVRLEASEIKWRGDRGKRSWLAGTVIEKMCALVDVSGLLQRVESSCKPV